MNYHTAGAARRQLHRGDSIKARRLFTQPGMRIQPRLVGERVKQAFSLMAPDWFDALNESKIYRADTSVSLDEWELRQSHLQPMNVGHLMMFHPRTDYLTGALINGAHQVRLPHYDAFAAVLQSLLDVRNLGSIYRYQVDQEVFLLVSKNIGAAMQVPGAFKMFDDPTVERYTGNLGALWEPIGRPPDHELA